MRQSRLLTDNPMNLFYDDCTNFAKEAWEHLTVCLVCSELSTQGRAHRLARLGKNPLKSS